MPTLETLTDADVRGLLTTKSLRRALNYVSSVRTPVRSGHTLAAQVRGSRMYEVEIDVKSSGIDASCSCPYDWGGYCKHVGAVLLKWIQSPDSFADEAPSSGVSELPIQATPVEPPPTRRPEEFPFWMQASFADRCRDDRVRLEEVLMAVKLQDLRRMAREREWKIKGNRKASIVRQIMDEILNPGGILSAVLNLDAEHQQVLRALILLDDGGGAYQESDVKRVADSWGKLQSYKQISTYTDHLCDIGLAVSGEIVHRYGYRSPNNDFVPFAISRHLLPVLEGVVPATADLESDRPASELRFADPGALVHAAAQIALLLEQSPVSLRPPMPRPKLEKFNPALEQWDYDPPELLRARESGKLRPYADLTLTVPPPARSLPDEVIERLAPVAGGAARLEFIFTLLLATGLFQPGSPVTIWPEVKEEFLRHDELAQRTILARVYLSMQNWNALWEVLRERDDLQLRRAWAHQYFRPVQLSDELVHIRRLVVRVLASLPDCKWVTVDDLLRLMRTVWPQFNYMYIAGHSNRPSSRSESWFLASTKSGKPLDPADENDWELAQGNFVRYLITGPLHWLGLADLSISDGVLTAIRLHGLADLYWERVETLPAPRYAPAPVPVALPAEAVMTDNHSISVKPSVISAGAHSLLSRIARLEITSADLFVYQLDPHTVHETFETGTALSDIMEAWEQSLAVPMPESIRTSLNDWWEAYGRVRIYEDLTVIEFSDDYALPEMKAVTSLEECLIAEVSPRLVIIPQEAVVRLTAELEKAGYTPRQTDQV